MNKRKFSLLRSGKLYNRNCRLQIARVITKNAKLISSLSWVFVLVQKTTKKGKSLLASCIRLWIYGNARKLFTWKNHLRAGMEQKANRVEALPMKHSNVPGVFSVQQWGRVNQQKSCSCDAIIRTATHKHSNEVKGWGEFPCWCTRWLAGNLREERKTEKLFSNFSCSCLC